MMLNELLIELQQIKDCYGGSGKVVIEHCGMLTSLKEVKQIKIKKVEFDTTDLIEERNGFPVLKTGPSKPYPPPIIILEEGDRVKEEE